MAYSLRFAIILCAIAYCYRVPRAQAANYTVTTGSGSSTGSLNWAINSANAAGGGPHTITVSPSVTTISVAANLPVINTNVAIVGNGTKIVGNNRQLFVVNSGKVALQNMNVSGGRALGGTGGTGSGGGGGGLGAGGALFVNSGAAVSIENVTFDNNRAQGGNGGNASSAEGGGGGGGFRGAGGSGGNGSNIGGGGGGGGLVGRGGNGSTAGGGGGGGGTSNGSNGSGTNGGNGNGGGGKGGNSTANGAPGTTSAGGGGGGGQNGAGGTGNDFGGGGGGGGLKAGASGGFGAGGGGAGVSSTGGAGGFGGGAGGKSGAKGDGGSGFGGAVFVRQGGSLTIVDSTMTATNSTVAGTGNAAGQTAGSNLYLMKDVSSTFGGAGLSQLSGSIAGDGSLVKNDSGTLILSGTNTYTGGTTVSGGTLQGTTASLQRAIVNDAQVTFDQSTNGTYAGTMSGSGALVKSGTGTVTLTGPNSYSGGTTVSGGKLQGATSSLQGNIANNANVELNQNANGTYAGSMSGSGALVKSGTGTVTLTGPNTYSGGTTVSGGALRGSTSSLQGNITNNATTEFDQATHGTYAGTMSGSGALVKSGTGTVTLNGPNSYSGGTTVNGGTLRGTTSSLQGNISNNAVTEFDQATNGTYAGTMSGNGALVKSGTGTVTLTGPNSYSGGTSVSGGTLRGTTSSLQGNITNDANVEFAQNIDGTYTGTMSGSGALVKSGTSTVTLAGPNSYSGGTTVDGGTLRGNTTSLQGDVLNNARVEFDQNSDGTYAGTMSGSGALVKSGAGTVTLAGPNSYAGGTTVSGGVLVGDATSLRGDIANNAHVTFDQAGDGTYAGVISGTGGLTKSGSGVLTMNGNSSYTGMTEIDAGGLIVNGNLTSDVTVATGASLDGSGNILGNVTNYGTVGTGNSIGTRTVAGTYTQQAGSILQVEINDGGTTPGVNNDLIQADSVVLNGGTVAVLAEPGNYAGGSRYRFLSSTTALAGQFDAITIHPSAYSVSLDYDYFGGLYWASFTFASDFDSYAQTANQLAVANYLDSISSGATGDLSVVLAGLDSLANDPAAMRSAFDAISGQVDPTLAAIGLQNTTQQLAGQLRSERLGMAGTGGSFGLTEPPASSTTGPVVLVSYNRQGAPQVTFVAQEEGGRWNGWTMGYGLGGSAATDGNAAGLTYGMGGTLLGLDRQLGSEGRLGFFGGYQGTSLRLTGPVQTGLVNGGMLGTYLYQDDGFNYYSVIGGAQFNGYETSRRVVFDGINRTANGDFSGWQGYGYLERGVNLRSGLFTLQPYAALQTIYLRQNSYTETGADSLNLASSGIDANSLRSLIGARLQTNRVTRGGHRWQPELRALWLHEFLATDVVVNSFFAPIGGSSFAIDGLNLGRDWAILGGGLRYELPSGWQLVANYDAQVNTQQVFHVGSGSLQYAW